MAHSKKDAEQDENLDEGEGDGGGGDDSGNVDQLKAGRGRRMAM